MDRKKELIQTIAKIIYDEFPVANGLDFEEAGARQNRYLITANNIVDKIDKDCVLKL